MTATAISGLIDGKVIFQNRSHGEAPSMEAAS